MQIEKATIGGQRLFLGRGELGPAAPDALRRQVWAGHGIRLGAIRRSWFRRLPNGELRQDRDGGRGAFPAVYGSAGGAA